jgi:hypothetical protein
MLPSSIIVSESVADIKAVYAAVKLYNDSARETVPGTRLHLYQHSNHPTLSSNRGGGGSDSNSNSCCHCHCNKNSRRRHRNGNRPELRRIIVDPALVMVAPPLSPTFDPYQDHLCAAGLDNSDIYRTVASPSGIFSSHHVLSLPNGASGEYAAIYSDLAFFSDASDGCWR